MNNLLVLFFNIHDNLLQTAVYKQQLQLFTQGTRKDPNQGQVKRVSTPGSQSRRGLPHHLSTPDVQSAARQSRRSKLI